MIFVLIPFLLLELYVSLKVGERIGFLGSALWIILSMIIGVRLLQTSPLAMVGNFNAMAQGKLSMKSFENAATSYMLGSILLIIPGVVSDFLGIAALLYAFYLQFTAKMKPEQPNPYQKQGDKDVIDVEVIDEYSDRNDRA
jgi:UPF0716 protein FxsA